MKNAALIRNGLIKKDGLYLEERMFYVWLKCPEGNDSWSFFDQLLEKCHIVGTPGVGLDLVVRVFRLRYLTVTRRQLRL